MIRTAQRMAGLEDAMKNAVDPGRRRIVAGGAALAGALVTPQLRAQNEYGDGALHGAGSTFVEPLMQAWVRQYRYDPYQVLGVSRGPDGGLGDSLSNDGLDYEPVGSLAGIQRIRSDLVDFAASEMPLSADFLKRNGLIQFPWTFGAVAVVAMTAGAGSGPLRLDAPTLARIFLGKITRWSDRAIAQQNPGAKLPDAQISVLHRSDGSGTTFTFSTLLARNDSDWKQRLGADLLLKWPVGRGWKGNDGVLQGLKSTPHSIGYINALQARQAKLPIVALRNTAGSYVLPETAAIAAAVATTRAGTEEVERLPIDSPGEASYPLVATVFGLMRDPVRSARGRRTADFVAWTMIRGAGLAQQLGYRSLPEPATKAIVERLTGRL
jgi:phosphate transport system substrate-binding protein